MARKELMIELNKNNIKCILYKNSKNKEILEYFIVEIEEKSEEENDLKYYYLKLKEILIQKKWEKYYIKLILNDSAINIRSIEIPKIPKNEIEVVVRREAKKFYGDLKEEKLIYKILGEVEDELSSYYKIYLVVIPDFIIKDIKALDLKIRDLEFSIYAMNHLFYKELEEDKNIMFIDFAYKHTRIFLYKGKNLEVFREINIAGYDIDKSIENMLGISLEESRELKLKYGIVDKEKAEKLLSEGEKRAGQLNFAYQLIMDKLIRKLEHSMDYFKTENQGKNIEKVYLTGGSSNLKGVLEFLKFELNIENIEYLNLLKYLNFKNVNESYIDDSVKLSSLIGGILKEEDSLKLEKDKSKNNNKFMKYLYVGIASLPFIFILVNKNLKLMSLEKKKKYIEKEILSIEEISNMYDITNEKMNKLKAKINQYENIIKNEDKYEDFLYKLSYLSPKNIYFNSISYSESMVNLNGYAVSKDDFPEIYINNFMNILQVYYDDVKLKNTREIDKNSSNFEISLNIKEVLNNEKK